jgi:hypothetical protein
MKFNKNTKSITLLFTTLILLFCGSTHAQEASQNTPNQFWQNVRFGGGIGLGFANGFFSATLAPSAIYQFNDAFGVGLGLNGTINNRKNIYKSTILGGSIIGLYNPASEIQLSAEFEELNINRNFDENFVSNVDDKYWYSALFLGAGYRTGPVTFGIRYDVLYDEDKSLYAEPWIPFVRVYF